MLEPISAALLLLVCQVMAVSQIRNKIVQYNFDGSIN